MNNLKKIKYKNEKIFEKVKTKNFKEKFKNLN